MIGIFKSKQFYIILIFMLAFSIYSSQLIRSNDFNYDLVNFYNSYPANGAVRYTFTIFSIVIIGFVHRYFYHSTIFIRNKSRHRFLKRILKTELLLAFMMISIFWSTVFLFHLPKSYVMIKDIFILILNYMIVFMAISLLIKIIDIVIKKQELSSIIFLLLLMCIDYSLEHFTFFFTNNTFTWLGSIYTIYYAHSNSFPVFASLILVLIILYNIVDIAFLRKDFLIKNVEDSE